MTKNLCNRRTLVLALGAWSALTVAARVTIAADGPAGFRESGSFAAAEATQGAAADERFVYAIANKVIAKYDRQGGARLAVSSGDATHLNTGFFLDGKMYCAHSNFPQKPDRSDIKVLDPETMTITVFKDFGASEGSLTWAVRERGAWWCNFAYYGEENGKSYLVRYNDMWRETSRWSYPPELITAFGKNSASCGIWRGRQLLVTGHDERELFVLELPTEGTILRHVATVPAPFTGQGFAVDPVTQGLIGIDRRKRRIIFASRADAPTQKTN